METLAANLRPAVPAEPPAHGRVGLVMHVGDALARLYDLPYLQTHPLVGLLGLTPHSGTESAGRRLQRMFLDVIEALGPSKREAAERTSRILTLRYIDGVEVAAIQRELAIGRSQYYREQQRAVEAVASLLWDRYAQGRGAAVMPPAPARESGEPPKLTALVGGGLAAAPPLPLPLTRFLGREREMAEVERLLGISRLLTLTGPPGAGKTRLALEAAAHVNDRFEDGVYFVALAPLEDPALVIPTVAQVLGVHEQGSRPLAESLVGAVGDRAALLVLDNLEQIAEAGPAIAHLLQKCPRLRALATSRVRLHVSGEQEFPVPPLDVRGPRNPSVALFVDRARLVNPDFRPSREDYRLITQICAGLDGLPLAIELAAARINLLPPRDLAALLSRRLDLLFGGPRDLPDRHRTLRAAIAWSYDLLEASERVLFEQLSVFAGGWTLDAAQAVCAGQTSVLNDLAALVDSSLVRREVQEDPDASARFTMLETIREFAGERLLARGQEDEVRDRHASYFLAVGEQAATFWFTPHRARELDRVARGLDNLRAAMDWLETRDAERTLRLTVALGPFWIFHGSHAEGCARLAAALAMSGPSHRTPARAQALVALATLYMHRGDLDAACPLLYEALAIQREVRDLSGVGWSYWCLGRIAFRRRETAPAAVALIGHGLAIARAVGDQHGIANGLVSLGQAMRIAGDPVRARAYWEEGRAAHLGFGVRGRGLAACLCHLAGLAVDGGDLAAARPLVDEALAIGCEMGDALAIARALDLVSARAAAIGTVGEAERGVRLAGAAAALREASGVPLTWYQDEEVQRWLVPARALLGARAAEVWDSGEALTPESAIAEAIGAAD